MAAHVLKDATPRGASVDNLALEIQEQADEMFPNRTDSSMFLKLFSEIGELVDDPSPEEWADVMIMLLDFGSRRMWSLEDAIRKKMQINAARKFESNEYGVFRHVE